VLYFVLCQYCWAVASLTWVFLVGWSGEYCNWKEMGNGKWGKLGGPILDRGNVLFSQTQRWVGGALENDAISESTAHQSEAFSLIFFTRGIMGNWWWS
jgi:hypothetical protein